MKDSLAEEGDLLGAVHDGGAAEGDFGEETTHSYAVGVTAGEGELHGVLGRDEGDDGAEDVIVELEELGGGEATHEVGRVKEKDICRN